MPIETQICFCSLKNCRRIFHRQTSPHFDSKIMFRRENHIKNSVFYFDPKIYNFARKLTKKIVLLYFKCEILLKNPLFVLLCLQNSKNGKHMYFVLDQKQHIAQRHIFIYIVGGYYVNIRSWSKIESGAHDRSFIWG